ncbi:helix-turn-helix transcriptional regulator [uncultured Desulfovibrio sp.]|uniref:helix-turn-helix domain-containing protein n=2 Tax=uncultured Desulfovibrio sp. TaxID=167968 RepID=UPI002630BA45|nr:helix-turn-helix transcriptional regulator [uncultured Desulfovibrio sp.]
MKTFSTLHDLRRALSDRMKNQGLTQQDVAGVTGITQSAISMFIRGKRGLSGDAALKIQNYLLTSPSAPVADNPAEAV